MQYLLETKKLTKIYKETGEVLEILKDVDFGLEKGSIGVLTGASGSGKSTFLNIVGILDKPTSGSVFIKGKDISELSRREVNRFHRRNLGFMFQFHHLLAEFNALENVMMPARIDRRNEKESNERAMELLDAVGLSGRARHLPRELSGGERQRIALARALVNRPDLIIADEPSGNLDEKNADILKSLILELCQKFGQAFLIATHDMSLAGIATHRWNISHGTIKPLAVDNLRRRCTDLA
ncbi:MAG: ABC transporter ATP-binding protein [Fibromonadaceae bacterium]|jgi:lipoprotein-releasing system ATP-binding protein|nr:ABC transporter ATP-binding protein [Fibromonadaceae bacterium]